MFLIFPFLKVYGLHAALCYCPPGKLESLHILSTQEKKRDPEGFLNTTDKPWQGS